MKPAYTCKKAIADCRPSATSRTCETDGQPVHANTVLRVHRLISNSSKARALSEAALTCLVALLHAEIPGQTWRGGRRIERALGFGLRFRV